MGSGLCLPPIFSLLISGRSIYSCLPCPYVAIPASCLRSVSSHFSIFCHPPLSLENSQKPYMHTGQWPSPGAAPLGGRQFCYLFHFSSLFSPEFKASILAIIDEKWLPCWPDSSQVPQGQKVARRPRSLSRLNPLKVLARGIPQLSKPERVSLHFLAFLQRFHLRTMSL